MILLLAVLAAAPAAPPVAATPPAAPCRIEWRANGPLDHNLDDGCLPAVSADGRNLAVARIESGSFTILILSVAGKGRLVRSLHAADVGDPAAVKATVAAANAVLARGGYQRLPELVLPAAETFRLQRDGFDLSFDGRNVEVSCGAKVVGQSRRLGTVRDQPLGSHREILTSLYLATPATFALMKVEPVNDKGFYLPGGVEWIVVPLTACH